MVIPVKELLQLEKANASSLLSIYYTAKGMAESRMLTAVQLVGKRTAYHPMEMNDSRHGVQHTAVVIFNTFGKGLHHAACAGLSILAMTRPGAFTKSYALA